MQIADGRPQVRADEVLNLKEQLSAKHVTVFATMFISNEDIRNKFINICEKIKTQLLPGENSANAFFATAMSVLKLADLDQQSGQIIRNYLFRVYPRTIDDYFARYVQSQWDKYFN